MWGIIFFEKDVWGIIKSYLWGIIKLFIFIKLYNLLNYFKLSLKFKYVMWLKVDVDDFLTSNHLVIGYRNFSSNQFWDNSIRVI